MKAFAALLAAMMAATPAGAIDFPKDWEPPPIERIPNHREDWRNVVIEMASYAKKRNKDFIVLVHGGVELVVKGEREAEWEHERDPAGLTFEKRLPLRTVFRPYVKLVDGLVLDGLYCGPFAFPAPVAEMIRARKELDGVLDDERKKGIYRQPVPVPAGPFSVDPKEELRKHALWKQNMEREERQRRMVYAIDAMRDQGRRILSIEDCATQKEVATAQKNSDRDRVLTFAGTGIARLDKIPKGHAPHENPAPVTTVTAARNWLPMLRGDSYGTRAEWVMALEKANQDLLVVDVAHRGTDALTREDVARIRFKQLGSPRLVLAYLSVGKASDLRWYWQKGWEAGSPPFLFAPDDDRPGVFTTDMADPKWRELLGKYIAGIVDLGFDGVVLGDLDTYLWFEQLMPLKE